MSIASALYTLLIGPIELLFQFIFWISTKVLINPGYSIIALSISMNFLVLPLYIRADALQEEYRKKEKSMRPYIANIKKAFHGDERFMILRTYYRQNHYSPLDSLKGSVSLLLEIPFFLAAYNLLSNTTLLRGIPFGPIWDLSEPDKLITLYGNTVNIMPFIMTAINIIACMLYSTEASLKNKIQLYGMALIFLVLLYDSPSGLVLYWTLNNLFSLLKNICYRIKNKDILKKVISYAFSSLGLAVLLVILFIHPMHTWKIQLLVVCAALMMELPLIYLLFLSDKHLKIPFCKGENKTYLYGTFILTLLTGCLIPSEVLKASPEEFILGNNNLGPLIYIAYSTILAIGTFIIWGGIFYALVSPKIRKIIAVISLLFAMLSINNYMLFGHFDVSLSPNLVLLSFDGYSMKMVLANLVEIFCLGCIFCFVWNKNKNILLRLQPFIITALLCMSALNLIETHQVLNQSAKAGWDSFSPAYKNNAPQIQLNKKGKNVVVLMLDRAVSSYVPYIMKEKPELQKTFSGFTYYPNAISYGSNTIFGAPALYGGYEYTPAEMNRRDDLLMKDKHDEALRVMPVIFDDAEFNVTVSDISYAGYREIPDLSIYEDHPDIYGFLTANQSYNDSENMQKNIENNRRRNFFCYSISQIVPLAVHTMFYSHGTYFNPNNAMVQIYKGPTEAFGTDPVSLNCYNALKSLKSWTKIEDSAENTFFLAANELPHSPAMLQAPDYNPSKHVNNSQYLLADGDNYTINGHKLQMDSYDQISHYHVNMATFLVIGEWLDYLREKDVYDNTRIILVSDHGYHLNQISGMSLGDNRDEDIMLYNALLMVKDFGDQILRVDHQFMTNADVPSLAFQDLILNPVNPATGNRITVDEKYNGPQYVFCSDNWKISDNNGTKFAPGIWHSVHDDIFELSNWTKIQ